MSTQLRKQLEDSVAAADGAKPATLAAALIAAQAEIRAPVKDKEVEVFSRRTNSKYKFKYATMAGMIETLRPILTGKGLWFAQFVRDGEMVTRILHESGEHLDCGVPMLSLPDAPQEAGSVLTYFKRYSFSAAFGLVAEEEDDANIAEGNGYSAPRSAARNGTEHIDDAQWALLTSLIEQSGTDTRAFCEHFRCASVKALPKSRFADAETALRAKLRQKNKEPVDA